MRDHRDKRIRFLSVMFGRLAACKAQALEEVIRMAGLKLLDSGVCFGAMGDEWDLGQVCGEMVSGVEQSSTDASKCPRCKSISVVSIYSIWEELF